MKERRQSEELIKKVLFTVLAAVSFLASVSKILTGFDIDEAYALAMPYRILQGDRLFSDMWEVHQTSAFLPFLFIRIFSLFSKDMAHLVIYMRCIAVLIHFGMSIIVFFAVHSLVMKRYEEKENSPRFYISALSALIYYNFLPKWMMNLDFSMQQLWFFTLFLIFLFCGMDCSRDKNTDGSKERNAKKGVFCMVLAGLMLAMDVLAYPGMVILYPVTLILLLCRKEKNMWRDIIALTLGCVAAAGVFFLIIFSYMSPAEFVRAVPKVFMDGAHQYDAATKLSLYASQWTEVLVQTLILTAPALLVSEAVYRFYPKSKVEGNLPLGLLFCVVFEAEVSLLIIFAGLFTTWGPFRLQVRYIIQFAMTGILLYWDSKNARDDKDGSQFKDSKMPVWIWWLSLAAFVGILIASNVGPSSSASYLIIGNILFAGVTVLAARKQGKVMEYAAYAGAVLFLLSLIMCKGFYMRNTEYVPGDLTQGLSKIEEGPLAGVYVRNEEYPRYVSNYHTIRENTTESDRVLFMGTESLSNLYGRGKIVSPTTISTPAFNEQWVEYFTLYPEKMPTVIFLAKNTVDDREKFFAKNPFGIWIAKYYDVECMEETDSFCILRLILQTDD